MNKTDKKFIVTTFAETAEILKGLGFQLIQKSGNQWTFLNSGKIVFTDNVKDVSYTNILNV